MDNWGAVSLQIGPRGSHGRRLGFLPQLDLRHWLLRLRQGAWLPAGFRLVALFNVRALVAGAAEAWAPGLKAPR